ncbi:MAG TPA: DUF924 family protein [Bauldia sp.]|nr:DUF924 family protein [Bauldia sp.]
MPSAEQTALQPILRDIHHYWFGELKAPTERNREKAAIWFRQSDEVDAHIRNAYGRYIAEAAAIDWDIEALSREEQAALVVLLDQFPRNIYRTTGEAFAHDAKAREIARRLIDKGLERFWLHEQTFICVPFEHSEEIADQDYAVMLFAKMAVEAPDDWKDDRREGVDYATKHRDIIRKFGRFPHRNAMLGRESTPEEVEFLKGGRGY